MNEAHAPFLELKEIIRNSATQFRSSNDTSESLFHPKMGFVYAYDMKTTNDALDGFEKQIPIEYDATRHTLTVSQKLITEARELVDNHPDMEIRDFARAVSNYMIMHVPINRRVRSNPLTKLTIFKGVSLEEDVI